MVRVTGTQSRSSRIIGDIVSEWTKLVYDHFGGPVKTLVFSADVAHGEEIVKAFQGAGHDFRQSTYLDDDKATSALVSDFRKGHFTGLVSVEKFTKGFDVPDVLCLVGARPYSSSLASVIQQMGRGMRTSDGKDYCLYLDHAENIAGWWEEIQDVWEFGVPTLPAENKPKAKRREKAARADVVCKNCGFASALPECPGCGAVRPRRSKREVIAGTMEEVTSPGSRRWKENEAWVWQQVSTLAYQRRGGDVAQAQRTAAGYFKAIYGRWPGWGRSLHPTASYSGETDPRVERAVNRGISEWRRSNK